MKVNWCVYYVLTKYQPVLSGTIVVVATFAGSVLARI